MSGENVEMGENFTGVKNEKLTRLAGVFLARRGGGGRGLVVAPNGAMKNSPENDAPKSDRAFFISCCGA
jgi:hypothetical protein